MGLRGPQPQKIDWEAVKKLASIQCTRYEIASFLGISDDTLERASKRDFSCTIGTKLAEWAVGGKCSLRRKQWKLADTNAAMAIFLGKQYLGQTDEYGLNNKGSQVIEVVHYGDGPASCWKEGKDCDE